jgi:hypothetical protein
MGAITARPGIKSLEARPHYGLLQQAPQTVLFGDPFEINWGRWKTARPFNSGQLHAWRQCQARWVKFEFR